MIVLLVMLLLFAHPAWSETRIAAVNINRLMENAPQAQSASLGMKEKFSKKEQVLLSQRDEIREMEARYKREKDMMSAEEKEKLEEKIRGRLRDFKRESDDFTEDFSLARNEVLNKLQSDVYKAIVSVAERENYDLVVSESVLYASKRIDITDQVLTRLKELNQ
ncbi:MAG TPA: OmpH family outer membrane protein [Gammaproteobacteria bacterium]|nr:OmpH family outer membrane protein [Gammaproteobacteria bacterium]